MSERIKLIITEVGEVQKVGDKQLPKLSFKAKNSEGKELSYFTFNQKLFPSIVKDTTIEADIEATPWQSGDNSGINRKVVQIYVNGQAIVESKGQGGGKQWGKSPEQLATERASIESQTAFNGVIELLVAKVIELNNPLAIRAVDWASEKLGGEPQKSKTEPKVASATEEGIAKVEDKNGESKSFIDMGWLTESLKTLQKKGKKAYYDPEVIKYLDTITNPKIKSKTVAEAVSRLNKDQAANYVKTIETALVS